MNPQWRFIMHFSPNLHGNFLNAIVNHYSLNPKYCNVPDAASVPTPEPLVVDCALGYRTADTAVNNAQSDNAVLLAKPSLKKVAIKGIRISLCRVACILFFTSQAFVAIDKYQPQSN
jgi:hypothetical protein